MPSKFLKRDFKDQGIYHIFNRGVDNRIVFSNDDDYQLFSYYLYIYLTPLEKVLRRYHTLPIRLFNKNVSKQVDLLSYCLMPTHFHLILRQKGTGGISQFMKQLSNAYTQYFNHKYKRTGSLFEGSFKSIALIGNEQLVYLSRYIHLDPVNSHQAQEPEYQWSSYNEYIDKSENSLCHTKKILDVFPSIYAYKKFVHDQKDYHKKLHEIKHLIIE